MQPYYPVLRYLVFDNLNDPENQLIEKSKVMSSKGSKSRQ